MKTYVSTQPMSLRADHTTAATKINTLVPNQTYTVDDVFQAPGELWAHLTQPAGWVAVIHEGKVYGTYTDDGQTPPPPATVNVRAIIKAVITWQGDDGKVYTTETFPAP